MKIKEVQLMPTPRQKAYAEDLGNLKRNLMEAASVFADSLAAPLSETAEMASSLILLSKSQLGMPVSTTHVAVGDILGVGGMKKLSLINWRVTRQIFISWMLTIPTAAAIGWSAYWLFIFAI